ncbi:MAG: hypothetical protein II336_02385 [Loktanella sp.]|nr:hypothetical protein [Loktanella sp.]
MRMISHTDKGILSPDVPENRQRKATVANDCETRGIPLIKLVVQEQTIDTIGPQETLMSAHGAALQLP